MAEITRVLVLEDDDQLRTALVLVLEDEGYEVVGAARADEAVARAQEFPFDLIVADVRMPGMSGLDAVEQVRERQPEIRSMVVTGYASEADSVRALQLGVGQYLRKPFRMDQFLEGVKQLMAQRRQELQWACRERSLRKTSLWLLESLVRRLPRAQEAGPGLVGLGRLAYRVALELGLSEETAEECRLATLAALLVQLDSAESEGLVEELPVTTRRILEEVSPEGESPLESRIVAVGVALGLSPPSVPPPGEGPRPGAALAQAHPGAFDPQVLALVDQLTQIDTPGRLQSSATGRRQRGLLSLARMLEEAEQGSEAWRAYQEIVAASPHSREGVEALLGLARLSPDRAQLEQHARQACQASRQISPVLSASVALEAGLLLGPAGQSLVADSVRAYQQWNLTGCEARARLAHCSLAMAGEQATGLNEALNVLLQAQFSSELIESAPWLLPFLLRRQAQTPEGVGERALVRLARDAPREPARSLRKGRLSPAQRLILIGALQTARGSGWEEVVRSLESDPDAAVRQAARQALEASGAPSGPPLVRLYVFGAMEVFVGERRAPDKAWNSRKVRHMLARLAQAQRPIPEEVLIDDLWPEDAARGQANLRGAISSMRKALRPARWEGEDPQWVLRSCKCLALAPQMPLWHDLEEFSQLVSLAAAEEHSNPSSAVAHWRRAVQLYRGPYLEDCYSDWALLVRERVQQQLVEVLLKLCRTCVQHNHLGEAVDYAQRLVELDPCCQEGYLLLMRAHVALGRAEAAARVFERCARKLRQELAMEPSIELVEAHHRALLSLSAGRVGGS